MHNVSFFSILHFIFRSLDCMGSLFISNENIPYYCNKSEIICFDIVTVNNKKTHTDSTKINRPEHNIRMYLTNNWEPTVHVQLNIFGKTLIKVCSLHLYASFGTFCVQIGQLLVPQWVFKHSEEFRNRRHFPSKTANCRFSNIL